MTVFFDPSTGAPVPAPHPGQPLPTSYLGQPLPGYPQVVATPRRRSWVRRHPLAFRRIVATGVLVALLAGLAWVVWSGPWLDVASEKITAVHSALLWVRDHPREAWMAAGALVLTKIGVYVMLFEER